MAALGLCATGDDDTPAQPEPVFYLWPENVGLWNLWGKLQTQWRSSMNGRDGLDYTGVLSYLQHVARIKPRHMDSTMTGIQAMEVAALNEWARQAKDNKKG